MESNMYPERLEELSAFYWVKNLFSPYSFVTVTDAFPLQKLTIPTVSVESITVDGYVFEHGNRNWMRPTTFQINVFAQNKSQRDDFSYMIFNELKNGIPVYDYNEGFPENGVSPTKINHFEVVSAQLTKLKIFPELVDELYYRAVIDFTAELKQV